VFLQFTDPPTLLPTAFPSTEQETIRENPIDIFAAAKDGDVARIRDQLAADPSRVNLIDGARCTALHYAAQHGHTKACRPLIASKADVNAKRKCAFIF